MPVGNKHYTPSGIWWEQPAPRTYGPLFAKTFIKNGLTILAIFGLWAWRDMQQNYTYTNFRGKMMTFGNLSSLTHEPLSVEEIDKLREAERNKKEAAKLMGYK